MNRRFLGPDYVNGADTPRLDEKALLEPAPSALSGFVHELVVFQRPQVVVHLLPRDADPRREGGGRCRLCQLGERPASG